MVFILSESAVTQVRTLYSGFFTVPAAALFLRATTPASDEPIQLWSTRRRTAFVGPSSKHLYSWIRHSLKWKEYADLPGRDLILDFNDLIRMRMIVMMHSRGLPLHKIRDAEIHARHLTGSFQPFVTEAIWTYGSHVFVQLANYIVSASAGGQMALDFLGEYLQRVEHGLTFGPNKVAAQWRPNDGILIDPRILFGTPCIEGTRIPTETIWALHDAGDQPDRIARMYGIERVQVDAALDWEELLGRAA